MRHELHFCTALALLAIPASTLADLRSDLLAQSGGRRIKIVWQQDVTTGTNPADHNEHSFGGFDVYKLIGYDTQDGQVRELMSSVDDYSGPLISHDGSRVVYTDARSNKIWVVDWDSPGNRRAVDDADWAGTLWYDPQSRKEWVYVSRDAMGELWRVNLDNPSEKQRVWDAEGGVTSISADGQRVGGSWPWPNSGVIVPDYAGAGGGTIYDTDHGYYVTGCWTTITPDNRYYYAVFDSAHRNWRVFNSPTSGERTVDLNNAPGIDDWEVYHPKFSNDPRFLTLTGPYSWGPRGGNNIAESGPQVEVYFGKVDAGFAQVTGWVKVTSNNLGDYYPHAWVDPGDEVDPVRIDAFTADPTTIAAGESVTLSWSTSFATSVSISPGVGTVTEDGSTEVNPTETTTYLLRAEGYQGPVTREQTVTVMLSNPLHLKLNSGDGSPQVTGWDDAADYLTSGGSTHDFGAVAVDLNGQPDPAPEDLYRTCIHLDHSFSFPVQDGAYRIRLHFYDYVDGSGRAMDYTIEDQLVLDDFDIVAATGGVGGKVLIKEFVAHVVDGNGLQITASKDQGDDVFETGVEVITYEENDQEEPSVQITAPEDGATVGGIVAVTGTASDNVAVARIELSVDGGNFVPVTGTADWGYSLSTDQLSDGPHSLEARASDLAGNQASDAIGFIVSNEPVIVIDRPTGGEVWQSGATEAIQWRTENLDNVAIFFSADGGTTFSEVAGTVLDTDAGWRDYPWVVPAATTSRAVIRIQGYFGEAVTDSSLFTIEGPQATLMLTNPVGGETFDAGEVVAVQWQGTELDAVLLEFSDDDGTSWQPVASVTIGDATWGDQPWTVPAVVTSAGRIRASSLLGVSDTSGPFTIEVTGPGDGAIELTELSLDFELPTDLVFNTLSVNGVPVAPTGSSATASVMIPGGLATMVINLEGTAGQTTVRRMLRLQLTDAGPPIPGLAVSLRELEQFLGGRRGVLTWVDGGGVAQLLDFRGDQPEVVPLSDDLSVINPIISPDGTRVVYAQGQANGPKFLWLRSLTGDDAVQLGTGDVAYWAEVGGDEVIIHSDWSDKQHNGADGDTYQRVVQPGTTTLIGEPVVIHDRAMDAGPNRGATWMGQVYENLWAYDAVNQIEYPSESFFLMEGEPALHQVCNGSMAPDESARLMTLVIPHDWIRVFTHVVAEDRFEESSRFQLPPGKVEWEFPEWSTDPGFFSAILITADRKSRLYLGKLAEGDQVPELLEITGDGQSVSYSHLYVAP